ncbi:hypothetical protein VTO42DRAFT_5103 [Malbranchea cinnamomea]
MLAIAKAFTHWRHYLEGSRYPVEVLTDHVNLCSFMKLLTKIVQRCYICWIEFFAGFDFEILYHTGKSNPTDRPSYRPDYQRCEEDIDLPTYWVKQRWQRRSSHPWDPWHESPTAVRNGKSVAHLRTMRTRSAAVAQSKKSVSSQKKATPHSDDSDTTIEDVSEIEEQPQKMGENELVYLSPHLNIKELTQGETAFTDSPARMREQLLDL